MPEKDFKDLYLVFELFDGDLDRAVGLPQLTAAHIQVGSMDDGR